MVFLLSISPCFVIYHLLQRVTASVDVSTPLMLNVILDSGAAYTYLAKARAMLNRAPGKGENERN